MKTYVLDTSALIRFYIPDGPIPEGLDQVIESAWRSNAVIMIPEIGLAEIAQVLLKKEKSGFLKAIEADEIVISILGLPINIIGYHEYLTEALSMARTYAISVYDSLFLTLAVKNKAFLITADEKLSKVYKSL